MTESRDGREVIVNISGRFDFEEAENFRLIYEDAPREDISYILDMSETTYLDSSGLGLLLCMESQLSPKSEIYIKNCQPLVKKILDQAHFSKKFKID